MVDIELLVVPDCPHEAEAVALAERAAAEAGVGVRVRATVVATEAEAQARGFVGSPTFLVEGVDPFAVPGASVGVACRVYSTPGGFAGVPAVDALRVAIVTAAGAADQRPPKAAPDRRPGRP